LAHLEETPPRLELKQMPHPGTMAHLRYLTEFEIEPDEPLADPKVFLAETMAVTSLARMILKHRTKDHKLWSLQNQYQASLDTRFLNPDSGLPQFRGSVDLRPLSAASPTEKRPADIEKEERLQPPRNLIIVSHPSSDYSYDLVLPITKARMYDPRRPVSATYIRSNNEKLMYNEISDRDNEREPLVLISAIQEAADDLLKITSYLRHETTEPIEYPTVNVAWHPDYLSDDQDKFLKIPREQW
jgi:hypothetical protein